MKVIDLPYNIDYYQVQDITYGVKESDIILTLIDPISHAILECLFKDTLHFTISRTPLDEPPFQVGMVSLVYYEQADHLLQKLGFKFTKNPDIKNTYYLKVEGDICFEIVSTHFSQKSKN